jgi:hypothetical protein
MPAAVIFLKMLQLCFRLDRNLNSISDCKAGGGFLSSPVPDVFMVILSAVFIRVDRRRTGLQQRRSRRFSFSKGRERRIKRG